jgi:protein gp37
MADVTRIEWADSSFNPWIGCQHVSPGCDHCYAEKQNAFRKWTAGGDWGPKAERRRTSSTTWNVPRRLNAGAPAFARAYGRQRRIFCASLADVFDNQVPEAWRADLFRLIRETPELDWQVLTKWPQNIGKMLPTDWGTGYANVWLGVTCEDQEHYERRWPILARIPAVVRFVSYEPALAPLTPTLANGLLPDWIICGGESGPGARFMDPTWARRLGDRCHDLGVHLFMKQMTGKKPIPTDLLVRQFPMRDGTQAEESDAQSEPHQSIDRAG